MATTPKGIVYPDGSTGVTPLQTVFATLASSVDTALGGYVPTTAFATAAEITAGTVTDKVVSPKALKDANASGDTGWVSVTPASGFTGTIHYRVKNGILYMRGKIQRTAGFAAGTAYATTLTLPAGARPTTMTIDRQLSAQAASASVRAYVSSAGVITIVTGPTKPTYVDLSGFSGTPVD